jgi:hypothetical protein
MWIRQWKIAGAVQFVWNLRDIKIQLLHFAVISSVDLVLPKFQFRMVSSVAPCAEREQRLQIFARFLYKFDVL